MDILPFDKIGIVMRKVENEQNYYDIWYDDLGPSMIRLWSDVKLEPGQWVENIDGYLALADPPIQVDRIKRHGENNLFKLITKVLKPEDKYFESENVDPGVKKYQKYVGLSTDFGRIFLHKKVGEQMKTGVLYNVEVCNFALLQTHEERDLKILKVMKNLRTLWLASNFDKSYTMGVAELNGEAWQVAQEDLMNAHAYTLKAHSVKAAEQPIPPVSLPAAENLQDVNEITEMVAAEQEEVMIHAPFYIPDEGFERTNEQPIPLASLYIEEKLQNVRQKDNSYAIESTQVHSMDAPAYVSEEYYEKTDEQPMTPPDMPFEEKLLHVAPDNDEIGVRSQNGSDKTMESPKTKVKEQERNPLPSSAEFVRSLTKIVTNKKVRKACLLTNKEKELSILDAIVRHPVSLQKMLHKKKIATA